MRHMLRRGFTIALVLFQALWLNVIVPGHQRGQILLPGAEKSCHAEAQSSCCEARKDPTNPTDKKSLPARQANCAVCSFAARLTVATAIDLRLPPLMRLGMVREHAPDAVVSVDLHVPYHGRAPPAC